MNIPPHLLTVKGARKILNEKNQMTNNSNNIKSSNIHTLSHTKWNCKIYSKSIKRKSITSLIKTRS